MLQYLIMDSVILLWDTTSLWGLLARQALEGFGVPYRLVKTTHIAQALQSGKTRLVLAPGGSAKRKLETMGPNGAQALRDFVHNGGHYLGFCGGAGLGLTGHDGLGLCPWQRAGFVDRLQHFISGHVKADMMAPATQGGHKLIPPDLPAEPSLPVWWPGRFAPKDTDKEPPIVLASYKGPGSDFHMMDVPIATVPETIRRKWRDTYNVSLLPEALKGDACVIHGPFGKGSYTLSYSHLETPNSPEANIWLRHMLHTLTGTAQSVQPLPVWQPYSAPVRWDEMRFWSTRAEKLLALGTKHHLLFERTPWLLGWKHGVPGAGLNSLCLALRVLASFEPNKNAQKLWQDKQHAFEQTFDAFYAGAEELLLAWRLATSLPEAVPTPMLTAQRMALFGTAMISGGLYHELLTTLDELFFACHEPE